MISDQKTLCNVTEPSLPCSHAAETGRNYISNYILFNSQGGMIVNLLGLQPLKVLLPIPNITDEAIWIMSRMVTGEIGIMSTTHPTWTTLGSNKTFIVKAHELVSELNSY
jgi:hypothetical protein